MIDLKKRTPVIYARLSQAEAKSEGAKKLRLQIKKIQDFLKANGIKKTPLIFKEVASGTDPTRPEWRAAIAASMAKKNRVLAVFDFSRFSRDMRSGMAASIPMYAADVPILSTLDGIGLLTGTKEHPHPDGDLMWGIKTTLVTREVETTKEKERTTGKTLREAGVATVKGLALYPLAAANPWEILIEQYPRFKAKDINATDYGRLIADLTAVKGRKVSPGWQWQRGNVKTWLAIKKSVSPTAYAEWWRFLNRVRDYERSQGYDGAGSGVEKGKISWRVKALRRMSNAYLNEPAKYPIPTEDEWVEWTSNFQPYLSVKDTKLHSAVS